MFAVFSRFLANLFRIVTVYRGRRPNTQSGKFLKKRGAAAKS